MTTERLPDLGDAVADFAAGRIDAHSFSAAFADRTVYGVRLPGRPMLAAQRADETLEAAVFSSLTALAQWCVAATGPDEPPAGVDWYAMTGADLLTIWPDGCDLVVDPGTAHATRCPAQFLRREGDVVIRQRSHAGRR